MKFGLFLNTEHPGDADPAQKFREHLEQVRLARKYGFDSICVPHHLSLGPSLWFPPLPTLARVAAEAGPMALATTVALMPFFNPLDLAEQGAMLDVLCRGRFVLGVGAGWRREEFAALGVPMRERGDRLAEAVEVIKRLWTEDEVHYQGRYYKLSGTRLVLKPLQKPRPPIWVGASTAEAVRRAALVGDAWVMSSHLPFSALSPLAQAYREALRELGRPFPHDFPALRNIYIAADLATALREAAPHLQASYQVFGDWGLFQEVLRAGKSHLPLEELLEGRVILGGPEEVIGQLERFTAALGVNYLICRVQWLGMPQDKALSAIRLLGKRVLPHFRGRLGGAQRRALPPI